MTMQALRHSPDGMVLASNLLGLRDPLFSRTVRTEQCGTVIDGDDDRFPRSAAVGVRQPLTEDEGAGFWDIYDTRTMIVMVADATYRSEPCFPIDGYDLVKLRFVMDGCILTDDRQVRARGPQGELEMLTEGQVKPYRVTTGMPLRMVVLHCPKRNLRKLMGLGPDEESVALEWLSRDRRTELATNFALTPDMLHTTRRIIESRYRISRHLRPAFIESLAIDLLCTALADFEPRDSQRRLSALAPRDIDRIVAARDCLDRDLATPPQIAALARRVGINQTKLKTGFREVFGETVYGYVLKRRMEAAAELLRAGDLSIAEIAYRVGYEFPANFTCAFRRHFGSVPRTWRKQMSALPDTAAMATVTRQRS